MPKRIRSEDQKSENAPKMEIDKASEISWTKLSSAVRVTASSLPKKTSNAKEIRIDAETDLSGFDMKSLLKIVGNKTMFATAWKEFSEKLDSSIINECDAMEKELKSTPKSAYSTIRKIVGDKKQDFPLVSTTVNSSLNIVKNHFSMVGGSAYKGHEAISLPAAPKRLAKIDDGEFGVEELTAAMVKIKSGKATGDDHIPVEALRAISADQDLHNALLDIMNEVRKTGKADESWESILQVPLPKKGNLRSLTNWRPICLVNHVVKILNQIILDRIQPAVESLLRGESIRLSTKPLNSWRSGNVFRNNGKITPRGWGVRLFCRLSTSLSFIIIRCDKRDITCFRYSRKSQFYGHVYLSKSQIARENTIR